MNYLHKLSKTLPKGLVSLEELWPKPPVSLMDASNHLKMLYRRLLAANLMKSLTPETKSQFTLKIAASDKFKGWKSCYPSSVPMAYHNSYLCEQFLSSNMLYYGLFIYTSASRTGAKRTVI